MGTSLISRRRGIIESGNGGGGMSAFTNYDIFHLILVGVQSSLILPVKKRGV